MKTTVFIGACCFIFLLVSAAGADTIYMQNNPAGNQGEVLEEYPDAIVIRFPKNEIKRVEADQKPAYKEGGTGQKVIWIEDGDTITLRLPKQSVEVSSGSAQSLDNLRQAQPATQGGAPAPAGTIPSVAQMLAQDRVIQGKIFMKGTPLPNCQVRILRISNTTQDRLLRLLTGSNEKEEPQSYEATSDEQGIYTFKNVPYGEYVLYWKPAGSSNWIRRLSENPDITLAPGRPVAVRDIETNIRTVN